MKYIVLCLTVILHSAIAETKMGKETPECLVAPVKTEAQAKCIALFYASFTSTIAPIGAEWDVNVVEKGDFWFIYSKAPDSLVNLDTILYKINIHSGTISEFRPKNNKRLHSDIAPHTTK